MTEVNINTVIPTFEEELELADFKVINKVEEGIMKGVTQFFHYDYVQFEGFNNEGI